MYKKEQFCLSSAVWFSTKTVCRETEVHNFPSLIHEWLDEADMESGTTFQPGAGWQAGIVENSIIRDTKALFRKLMLEK